MTNLRKPKVYIALLPVFFILSKLLFLFTLIILFVPDNGLEEFRNKYEPTFLFVFIISPLAYILFIYQAILNTRINNTPELHETIPLYHWSYHKFYWEKAKAKEYRKKTTLYALTIAAIWIPIIACMLILYNVAEPIISIISSTLIIINTIPMIPFTLGEFIKDYKNQLHQPGYAVKIFFNGLTINERYYPYRSSINRNNSLYLIDIEEITLQNTKCLKFIKEKKFYDDGSMHYRRSHLTIPLPQNTEINIKALRNELRV